MPTYNVYQVQEEVVVHKSLFVVEAESVDDAIEMAMSGEVELTEKSTADEPGYVTWGWSARPADAPDDVAWEEAKSDLEERRLA